MRKLAWLAAGAWDRTAALMAFVAASFGDKDADPAKLNPFRPARPGPARPVSDRESKSGFKLLGRYLAGK